MKGILKIVFILTVGFFSCNLYAQCDHSDDIDRVRANLSSSEDNGDVWWLTTHTPYGWSSDSPDKVAITETYEGIQLSAAAQSSINLLSPIFTDGCSAITFQYKDDWIGEDAHLKVEVKQNDWVVWNETIIPPSGDWTDFSVDTLDIKGAYQLVVTSFSETKRKVSRVSVKDFCIAANIDIPAHSYQIHVPKDATVHVGDKDQTVEVLGNFLKVHYVPFTKKDEALIWEKDTSNIWYYNLTRDNGSGGGYNYRVIREGKAPHVGLINIKLTPQAEKDTLVRFTDTQLQAYSPQESDLDVNHLNGRNVADVFLNINAQGYLTLPLRDDTAFQLIHTRNWQAIDTDVNNYFIEPDFHYTVVDENGAQSSGVITVSDSGVIRPVGAGTAIVLVDYDAMVTHHTTNLGLSGDSLATHGALFSKLWPENTGVFVVAVGQPEANIITNMNLNDYWAQDGTDKTSGIAIDAEHDVMYFEAEKGSFPYTFTPAGVEQVLVATPTVGETITSYSGFCADSVTENSDGSYTVKLGFGRNIVKLVSAADSTYQVITAKPVTYTVSNITHPGEAFVPGDSVSVLFNTLYHPANKMSGIYNMSAGIQYSNNFTNFPLILGPGQYTFASRAQRYGIRIPDTFSEEEFVLDKGVIKTNGFGSLYGEHRNITKQNGVPPNLSASVREAYLGSIPDIHIPIPSNHTGISAVTTNNISVSPNPFTDYIVVNATENGTAQLFDILGKIVSTSALQSGKNHISTSTLPAGIYVLKVGKNTVKLRRM